MHPSIGALSLLVVCVVVSLPRAASTSSAALMPVVVTVDSQVTYPTGDPSFSVLQSFPAMLDYKITDPFLMCDHFGPVVSTGAEMDPDTFPIDWHPHRGFDLATVLVSGVGRHGDSLGNRETFKAPGLQWISAGSGIEHAEGGGTPAGEFTEGFQIWINVPSDRKMDDPRYGTHSASEVPTVTADGATVQVIAGAYGDVIGPFQTVQPVIMLNIKITTEFIYDVPSAYTTTLLYVYRGSGLINGTPVTQHQLVQLDGASTQRRVSVVAGNAPVSAMVFIGQRLNQPISRYGSFVMSTPSEIKRTVYDYQRGTFLRKRVEWDYKRISEKQNSHEL